MLRKKFAEKLKTRFLWSIILPLPENLDVREIMLKITVQPDRPPMSV
jgi:hypothetical protein